MNIRQSIQDIPVLPLAIVASLLAMAPFVPEPHLWQKLKMLFDGSLSKPIDIFDLFMHGTLLVVLIIKLVFIAANQFRGRSVN